MAKQKIKPNEITALRIKELRKNRNNMTQAELADAIGMQIQAINEYERLKRGIPSRVLDDIARVLNTSVDYLTGKTDEPNPQREALLKLTDAYMTARDDLMGYTPMQVESQIINAAETLFFGKLYNYKISLTCGIEKKDSNASNKGGSIVISLFKNGEEYIFDQSEFSDLLKNIGALIDFECFKIMQKRAVEETPLLSKANIILNREQREEAAQLNYDAVFSLYRKDSSVKTVKEEEE